MTADERFLRRAKRSSPRYLGDFDSASANLRAVAAFLHGSSFPRLGQPKWLSRLALASSLVPERLRVRLYGIGGLIQATPPGQIGRIDPEQISEWVVSLYPRRRYPAVMIGASDGAIAHLAAALGAPWLPQTYFFPVRRTGVDIDDPRQVIDAAVEPAQRMLERLPHFRLHQMHDPNQDRPMVPYFSYFRAKRLRLGAVYERFIEQTLEPGGTLFLVDCQDRWPSYRVSGRHYFQLGGAGIPEAEPIEGSRRIAEFLQRHGSHHRRWEMPEPLEPVPEAEWGYDPELTHDVCAFARRRGFRVVRIGFDEPGVPSAFVADLYRWWYGIRGLPTGRLFAECFIMLDPWWTLRLAAVPYWMTFNAESSAQRLEDFLDARPSFDDIHLTLFNNAVRAFGQAPIERWHSVLRRARRSGTFIGVDPDHYPADLAAVGRYAPDLEALPDRFPLPEPLGLEALEEFRRGLDHDTGMQWEALA